ncbi:MAG: hypothetical protein AAGE59_31765, partial [Cyanobacteria bacterium P01_F01_bin.86]
SQTSKLISNILGALLIALKRRQEQHNKNRICPSSRQTLFLIAFGASSRQRIVKSFSLHQADSFRAFLHGNLL